MSGVTAAPLGGALLSKALLAVALWLPCGYHKAAALWHGSEGTAGRRLTEDGSRDTD